MNNNNNIKDDVSLCDPLLGSSCLSLTSSLSPESGPTSASVTQSR